MRNNILVFGAGKSSTALIEYFLVNAVAENWQVTIADATLSNILEKTGNSPFSTAIELDIRNCEQRRQLISDADIVVSLLPPSLHSLVARDCLELKKNLLTASYIDEDTRAMADDVEKAGLLFLCEMGLDPGIDHMSAKKMIDEIQHQGGEVLSFMSHCGGLISPESDDNPWHYKISWNAKNIVHAGKAGALYRYNNQEIEIPYEDLFKDKRFVMIPEFEPLCWYPNRDSLKYLSEYRLENVHTFIRTTLRHPDFVYGWKNLVDLKFTATDSNYDTDGKTLLHFFKEHLEKNGFGNWLEEKLKEQFSSTKDLLNELVNLVQLEEQAAKKGIQKVEEFLMVDEKGDLQNIDIDHLKISAATTLADKMHDANLTLKQLFFLGMDDNDTLINKGNCNAADVLQFALENKLQLKESDKDLVVMMHDIEYLFEGAEMKKTGTLLLTGEDSVHTAMAKTVGLPLAIATRLILNNTIRTKGLHIPTIPEIYEPVLNELAENGIRFVEETKSK